MSGYVYIEYPKCLYQKDGATLVVENGEEEESAAQMGWMTAEQYHNPAPPAPAVPPAAPEGEEGFKPEGEDTSVDEPEDVDSTDESDAL